ncbi:hypothetical protein ACIREM_41805 [Streptomyces shenzhenensis]|uniref:hypothetical protein n=1 Tax=Streptomyces shenzhenensis TaxID=943815 RepID=UPI0038116807
MSGAGVAAVFLTSNQAGSVALLLAGAVLLIMAINGAPLIRARYQDYELFMARRRRRVVAAIEEDSPEEARQALQVLNALDPGASRDPVVAQVSGAILEREVIDRLRRWFPETVPYGGAMDQGVDAVVSLDSGRIGVQVKSGSHPLTSFQLRDIVHRITNRGTDLAVSGVDGVLVVTNMPLASTLSRRVRELNSIMPTAVVRWVDEQDDQALETAVRQMSSRFQGTE